MDPRNQGVGQGSVNPQDTLVIAHPDRVGPGAPIFPHGEIPDNHPPLDYEGLQARPLSPWAQRYGFPFQQMPDPIFNKFAEFHSGFAARRHGVFKSGYGKDLFFYEEIHSQALMNGAKHWQLGPLMHSLQFSRDVVVPGGHTRESLSERDAIKQVYDRELIRVDEDSWFPFLKKDRWFDTIAAEPTLHLNMWTVDDERVWGEIRVALEFLNRVLNALIKDKHHFLQTMLFGTMMYWDPVRNGMPYTPPSREPLPRSKVLLSYEFSRRQWEKAQNDPFVDKKPFLLSHIPTLGEDVWRERLNKLLEPHEWAIGVIEHRTGRTGGLTFSKDATTLLNVDVIKALMSDHFSLAERCAAQFNLMQTMLHELMHSLGSTRMISDLGVPGLNEIPVLHDLHYAGSAELGYAAENAIFGGVFREAHVRGYYFNPFAKHQITWPFLPRGPNSTLGIMAGEEHPDYAPDRESILRLVPAAYYSSLLSEGFWQDEGIPRKSDNHFHRFANFCSRAPNHPAKCSPWKRPPPVLEGRAELEALYDQGQLSQIMVDMVQDWDRRERLVNQIRAGWYDKERQTYEKSPWVYRNGRHAVGQFMDQWRKPPNERNIFMLVHFTDILTKHIWTSDYPQFIKRISLANQWWTWGALGFLMMAALPIRHQGARMLVNPLTQTYYFFPSDTVPPERKIGKNFDRPAARSENPESWIPLEYGPSKLVDPFLKPGKDNIPPEEITHLDYLNVVANIIRHWMRTKTFVSTPWLNEIVRLERNLRAQREKERAPGARASTWADNWDFQVPEYDPTALSVWDQERYAWVNAEN
ncbi:hypothetical protein O1611_g5939 [Lasiodiplodia mahajangana]|uniref:Uncharacterized protein n=1 Tax=Lasiodiplodia mahajangana TaxID=1108764 RepID=A0ACC2JK04_9PEZI|nr:hypothetical protein O1611_g5939 [Lasiodiplodia mahajangana]